MSTITLECSQIFQIGSVGLESLVDRVLVLVDEYRSGYECGVCGGKQKIHCHNCDGKGTYRKGETDFKCSRCEGKGAVDCPSCQGKGVEEGGIVIPDEAQNRPQSGVIVSVGELVGRGVQRLFGSVPVQTSEQRSPLKVGDKVLFGRFAGHDIKLNTTDGKELELRILNESECLTRIHGDMLSLRRVGKGSKEPEL